MTEQIEPPKPVEMPPFKAFLASNIPAVYDNTMSYYDELTGLIAWLEKEVVPNVNSAVTLVNELKDYVEHYFDNLDVQEEINNKLDAMAEAGTLQEIITEYIQANVAWTFDTVADMKLATNFVNGSYARTLGFHTINDGGGAIYKISDSGTANEKDVIAIGSTLYATLIEPTTLNPEIYGAYGDGEHDDTVALQYMFDKHKPCQFTKTYATSSTITIGNMQNISVNGESSVVSYSGATYAFLLQGIFGGTVRFGRINAPNGTGIKFYTVNSTDRCIYLNLYFNRLSCASKNIDIEIKEVGYVNELRVNGGTITTGDYGVYVVSDTDHNYYGTNGLYFDNVGFEGSDVNYYFESPYHKMAGVNLTHDRFVENNDNVHLRMVGKFHYFYLSSWSKMKTSVRLDIADATITHARFECPIDMYDSSTIFADGFTIDGSSRIVYDHLDKVATNATKTAHATAGQIRVQKTHNFVNIMLNGIKVDSASCDIVDTSHPIPESCRPSTDAGSKIGSCSTAGGKTGIFQVKADGSIAMNIDSTATGTAFYGCITYDPLLSNEAPESV